MTSLANTPRVWCNQRMKWMYRIVAIWALGLAAAALPALAEDKPQQPLAFGNSKEPVYIEADEMNYDRDQKIVVARGNVEVVQGERILMSQELAYHEAENIVIARGKVSILEPDGNAYYAEAVQLKDDFEQGIIQHFRVRMADGSLLAANEAERVSKEVVKLRKAVFSPCRLCKEDPTKAPLWQVKAAEVTHDDAKQRMYYKNAFLEVYGFPIAYTPYFSHPAPGADRKSGFLTPSWQVDDNLGGIVTIPYYWNIAPDKDATITLMNTTDEGPVMIGEYRQAFSNGTLEVRGSVTNPDKRDIFGNVVLGENEIRGHIDAFGNFEIDEDWGWGFEAKRSTDDTYLQKYGFGYEDTLTSTAFVNKIKGTQFFETRALAFQGLRFDDDPDISPLVVPVMQYSYESAPGYLGGSWYVDAGAASLNRKLGAESKRLSSEFGYRIPLLTRGGHAFDLTTSLRGDGFSVNDYAYINDNGALEDGEGFQGRIIPEASLSWRYPLMSMVGNRLFTLSPVVMAVVSPTEDDPQAVPNEDSQVVEFSDMNLFSRNRYIGFDRLETGTRVNYGIEGSLEFMPRYYIDYRFGQTFIADDDDPILAYLNSDGGNMSDYVGKLGLRLGGFDATYRFKLDQDDYEVTRSQVSASMNVKRLFFTARYDDLRNDPYLNDREQVSANAGIRFADYWTVSASGGFDLSPLEDGIVSRGVNLIYQDECLMFNTGFYRSYIRDRDIEPNSAVIFQLQLKNM